MTTVITDQHEAPVVIDGTARPIDPERSRPVTNPARPSEVVGRAALASPEEVDLAVTAATRAFPAWRDLGATGRAEAMRSAADVLDRELSERARVLTREHGKVLWESEVDVHGAGRILRYYADFAERYDTPEVVDDQRGRVMTTRAPFGVVAVIVPWNFPIILGFLMLGPALLAGNTIVVKPPEDVPLVFTTILRALAEHLPPGVVNVVPGVGSETGSVLAEHPGVRRITFTGSIATGQSLMRAAATNIKSISLELGGNDPAIVLEGARISDELVDELVRGVYTSSGQICYNVKRILVHRSHHDDFVTRFSDAVNDLVVGDGLDPASSIGPLTTSAQYEFVTDLLHRTARSGATVSTLGRRLDEGSWDQGHFVLPSVVTGAPPDSEVVSCEQFGPTVPVMAFDDVDQAVRLANAGEFGLAASVWDDDIDHAFQVANRIEAGTVFVNVHRVGASDLSMPFGGFKQSGLGRGHGWVSVEESSEVRVVAQRRDLSTYHPDGDEGE